MFSRILNHQLFLGYLIFRIDQILSSEDKTQFHEVYEKLKEHFVERIKIHPEYLAASLLDPAQASSEYLVPYLATQNVSSLQVLKLMVLRYETENLIPATNSSDDSSLLDSTLQDAQAQSSSSQFQVIYNPVLIFLS